MEFKFDLAALLSVMCTNALQEKSKTGDKNSQLSLRVMQVFQKHNIDVFEALEIMLELAAAYNERDN